MVLVISDCVLTNKPWFYIVEYIALCLKRIEPIPSRWPTVIVGPKSGIKHNGIPRVSWCK